MACPICNDQKITPKEISTIDAFEVDYRVCGKYQISRTAKSLLTNKSVMTKEEKLTYRIEATILSRLKPGK